MTRLRRTALTALAAALLPLAACAHPEGDRHPAPLTARQAETLALTRFTNYRAGKAHVTATIPLPGSTVFLDANLDWRAHTGYGLLRGTTPGMDRPWQHLLRWNRTTVAARFDWPGPAPATPPASGWAADRALTPSSSSVDTALTLLLDLAADRPDNAQLLQRSGAREVGSATIDGQRVTEYTGPATHEAAGTPSQSAPGASRTRYWIDSRDTLRRFAARLPGGTGWMTVRVVFPKTTTAP